MSEQISIPKDYYLNDTQHIIGDDVISFDVEKIELVENIGCLVYVKNAQYPHKAFPSPEGIHAVNMLKAQLRLFFNFPFLFLFPKKLAKNFIWFFDRCFYAFKVKKKYMCGASFNFYAFCKRLLTPILGQELAEGVAYALGLIVEYDDAYRFRLQDMASELNVELFKQNPKKEILRLFTIWESRDLPGVMINIRKYFKILMWCLYFKNVRKLLVANIQYFRNMRYDVTDWYWVAFKDDYKFGGKTHAERLAEGISVPAMFKQI